MVELQKRGLSNGTWKKVLLSNVLTLSLIHILPEETTFREAVQAEKSPLTRAVPGYDAENACLMLFEARCV